MASACPPLPLRVPARLIELTDVTSATWPLSAGLRAEEGITKAGTVVALGAAVNEGAVRRTTGREGDNVESAAEDSEGVRSDTSSDVSKAASSVGPNCRRVARELALKPISLLARAG